MLLEAKKSRELEQDWSLDKIQQKLLNIIGPLSKLWMVDEVKCSRKSGRMSLEYSSTAIKQTGVLVGQTSQSITYERRHNVLTSLLRDARKSTSILKKELDSLVEKSNKLFGSKFQEHFDKRSKLKTESKKLFKKVSYNKHGNNKPFSSGPPPNTRGGGEAISHVLPEYIQQHSRKKWLQER